MLKYIYRSGKCQTGGVETLRYRISLPEFSEYEAISEFYRNIFEAVLEYCENDLQKIAEKEYTECDIPKKKFRYVPLRYTLDGMITYEDERLIFVKLIAKLIKNGAYDSGRVAYDAHAWSKKDQSLVPPRQAAEGFIKSSDIQRVLRKKSGFLIENGKYFVYSRNGIKEISPTKE